MFRKRSADAGTPRAAPAHKPDPKNNRTVDGWMTLARFLRRYDRILGRAARTVRKDRKRGDGAGPSSKPP
jgi:hypothetical protein